MNILKGYAHTKWGQVHYRTMKSDGDEAIVLLHQTASSSKSFVRMMPLLASAVKPVALDTPGFGGSFDPRDIPSVTFLCDVLLAAIDDLGLQRFHIFGHHTGACIGVELAARHPDRLRSLILSGPLPMTTEEQKKYHSEISAAFAPDADGAYLIDTWKYLAEHGLDRDPEVLHRETVDHLRAWRSRAAAYDVVWFQDFAGYLKQVRCPLMLLCADDDLLWPFFERAKGMRPDAAAAVIPNGSNFCTDFKPRETSQAVLSFIAENQS